MDSASACERVTEPVASGGPALRVQVKTLTHMVGQVAVCPRACWYLKPEHPQVADLGRRLDAVEARVSCAEFREHHQTQRLLRLMMVRMKSLELDLAHITTSFAPST